MKTWCTWRKRLPGEDLLDDQSEAVRLHYLAYAKGRLGDEHSAKVLWKQSLKFKHLMEARENLDDLKDGEGHAPWGASFGKWVPNETMEQAIDSMRGGTNLVLARCPGLASLIPALLDRGDPMGREARHEIGNGRPVAADARSAEGLCFRIAWSRCAAVRDVAVPPTTKRHRRRASPHL